MTGERAKRLPLSLSRILMVVTFCAAAGGCFVWVRQLVSIQSGHDHLVAWLVFAIPALLFGACVCIVGSIRMGLIAFAGVFGGIFMLAGIANAVVPMLK